MPPSLCFLCGLVLNCHSRLNSTKKQRRQRRREEKSEYGGENRAWPARKAAPQLPRRRLARLPRCPPAASPVPGGRAAVRAFAGHKGGKVPAFRRAGSPRAAAGWSVAKAASQLPACRSNPKRFTLEKPLRERRGRSLSDLGSVSFGLCCQPGTALRRHLPLTRVPLFIYSLFPLEGCSTRGCSCVRPGVVQPGFAQGGAGGRQPQLPALLRFTCPVLCRVDPLSSALRTAWAPWPDRLCPQLGRQLPSPPREWVRRTCPVPPEPFVAAARRARRDHSVVLEGIFGKQPCTRAARPAEEPGAAEGSREGMAEPGSGAGREWARGAPPRCPRTGAELPRYLRRIPGCLHGPRALERRGEPLLLSSNTLLRTQPQLSTASNDGNTTGALELPRKPGNLGFACQWLINGSKMEFLTWVFPALVLLCTQQHRCIR